MTNNSVHSSPRRAASGFSLIEIMVGLLIGMLSVIIIMQVFGVFEGNKRTTTGGDDAQINGTIALYGLERDVREAGYGLNTFNLLGCSLSYKTTDAKKDTVTLGALAPVTINPAVALVPAGDKNTDTLLLVSGTSNSPGEGDLINTAPSTGSYPVSTPTSFMVKDLVVAQPSPRPTTCALTVDTVKAKSSTALTVDPGDVSGLALGSVVFNLGQALTVRAYRVLNGSLTVCDYALNNCGSTTTANDPSVWVPIASNIVSLRAQYGHDVTPTSLSGTVGLFDQVSPGSKDDKSGFPVQCGWARTLAIRLAIVARSAQTGKEATGIDKPTWTGAVVSTATPTNPTAVDIDLSDDSAWQNYRYKTLETTIPIRNMIWQGSQGTSQGGAGGC